MSRFQRLLLPFIASFPATPLYAAPRALRCCCGARCCHAALLLSAATLRQRCRRQRRAACAIFAPQQLPPQPLFASAAARTFASPLPLRDDAACALRRYAV
jgi:hypothetical protein